MIPVAPMQLILVLRHLHFFPAPSALLETSVGLMR